MKSKFDVTKGLCPECQTADSVLHWYTCPRKEPCRAAVPLWPADWSNWPRAFKHHLLCQRNPWLSAWWLALQTIPDDTSVFEYVEPLSPHHLFTDGSCHSGPVSAFNICSWSVTSASSGMVLSSGWLPGITQSIPRAEATAVLSALRWISRTRVPAFLWVDSKHTVDGVLYLMDHFIVPSHWSNRDLWTPICELLSDLQECLPTIRWWPSHLHHLSCEDCFHDWAWQWNRAVDLQAGLMNRALPGRLSHLRAAAINRHNEMMDRSAKVFAFSALFMRVAL